MKPFKRDPEWPVPVLIEDYVSELIRTAVLKGQIELVDMLTIHIQDEIRFEYNESLDNMVAALNNVQHDLRNQLDQHTPTDHTPEDWDEPEKLSK